MDSEVLVLNFAFFIKLAELKNFPALENGSVLLKAPLHTNAYNTWWWIGLVIGCWSWLKIVLQIISAFRGVSNE